jgi:N-methylhydantoinase A
MLLPATLEQLHARRIVVPPHPGLFSALGLLSTDLVFYDSRSAYILLTPDAAPEIDRHFSEMEEKLRARVGAAGEVRRSFDGRLFGQSWETPFVEIPDGPITAEEIGELLARFHAAYEQRYGNRFEMVPVQGVTYRVQLVVPAEQVRYEPLEPGGAAPQGRPIQIRYFTGRFLDAEEFERDQLPVGSHIHGPAVIREPTATTFVCPGQSAAVGRFGEIVIEREGD